VRFSPEGGQAGYYDERGMSMKRFFLASPLKFQPVVTSAFSTNRVHPVLREYRAHLGVDYRAPEGAPVVAVSDGVVLSAGMEGASGRLVHLRERLRIGGTSISRRSPCMRASGCGRAN
jgi:murein DD-endopeptidase MepM/ murein hydrolase activator NlpD